MTSSCSLLAMPLSVSPKSTCTLPQTCNSVRKLIRRETVGYHMQLSDTVNTRGIYVGCVPYLPLGVVCDGHVEGADRTTVLPNTAVGHWQTNERTTTLMDYTTHSHYSWLPNNTYISIYTPLLPGCSSYSGVSRTQPDWHEVVMLCHVHTHLQHSIH